MRTALALVLMSVSLAAAGCKKKAAEKAPEPAGSAAEPAGSAAGSAVEPAGSAAPPTPAPADEKMTKRGGNCPSMVVGSTTAATADAAAVTLTISATDPDAIASIQRRTEELLAEKQDAAVGGTHDQKGTYGGGMGMCPVVTVGATAKMEKNDKGVTVTLTPAADATVDKLKAQVDERIKQSADYVAGNIKPGTDIGNGAALGGGKGDHGSNHSGKGNGKGKDGGGSGGGGGTGGGNQNGTGGGSGSGDKAAPTK